MISKGLGPFYKFATHNHHPNDRAPSFYPWLRNVIAPLPSANAIIVRRTAKFTFDHAAHNLCLNMGRTSAENRACKHADSRRFAQQTIASDTIQPLQPIGLAPSRYFRKHW